MKSFMIIRFNPVVRLLIREIRCKRRFYLEQFVATMDRCLNVKMTLLNFPLGIHSSYHS
jgi:hypothetical protein